MRVRSASGEALGARVTNPAMPHIWDAVQATFLNSHTRRSRNPNRSGLLVDVAMGRRPGGPVCPRCCTNKAQIIDSK